MGAALGLLAAFTIGLADLFGRRVVGIAGPLRAAVSLHVVAVAASAAVALATASVFDSRTFWFGAVSGIGIGAGMVFYYGGLTHSTATIVAPLAASLTAVAPFGYARLSGESVSAWAVAGLGLAVVGLVLITTGDIDRSKVREGLKWGGAAGLAYGFGSAAMLDAATSTGFWPATAQRLAAAVLIGCIAFVRGRRPVIVREAMRPSLVGGTVVAATSVFILLAYSVDKVPAVVAVSTFPAFSVLIGRFGFGDSVRPAQALGIALTIAGVAAVSL